MSNWFKFTYYPYTWPDLTGKIITILRPTVPIYISYKGNASWPFQALVDSGADRNLFPAGPGRSIGINIESGVKGKIEGIGRNQITVYTHTVKIYIANYSFETKIDFSKEQQFPL